MINIKLNHLIVKGNCTTKYFVFWLKIFGHNSRKEVICYLLKHTTLKYILLYLLYMLRNWTNAVDVWLGRSMYRKITKFRFNGLHRTTMMTNLIQKLNKHHHNHHLNHQSNQRIYFLLGLQFSLFLDKIFTWFIYWS